MSRIGRMPVAIPQGTDIKIDKNNVITVKGKNGTLTENLHGDMKIEIKGNEINVIRPTEQKKHKALHGLTRSLINNMVIGVNDGFEKKLEINGVGYRVAKQGNKIVLTLGYSHLIEMQEPKGITYEVEGNNKITVKGADKQLVGECAAKIRSKRPPEVYKGKGIKYENEYIRRKEGKTGAKAQ
jgi:large subunit ribosomal protein L6